MLRKYLPFIGLCLGFFIIMMDITTVPLTYTTLMDLFHVSPAKVAWINNSYLITYAACLLLGGRLGDGTNRKIVILIAYLTLGIGSAVSGAGQTFFDVVIGRALMGVGAGLLTPQSMAYISILFATGGRGTALGIWGAVAGIATAIGPVMTQLFLTMGDWRWIMWINIPIAMICFLIAIWRLPVAPQYATKIRDILMSCLYGLCFAMIIAGIQDIGNTTSFTSMGAMLFALGTTVIMGLIWYELKQGVSVILPQDLWRDSTFLKVCLVSGLLGFSLTGFYLPLAFLLDIRMNFGPVAISTIMITIAVSNMLVGPLAGNISDRMPPETIVKYGLIMFAIANASLGLIGILAPRGAYAFVALCAVMVIAGSGTGLAFAPLANLALSRAQAVTMGRAAAFFNCIRQIFSALGGVVVALVFDSLMRLQLHLDFAITADALRESPNATAIASLVCFLLMSLSLTCAAFVSRRDSAEPISLAGL